MALQRRLQTAAELGRGVSRRPRVGLSFNAYASQALFRRVAEATNLGSFVKQALTHASQVGKFTRNPIYARGTVDKIQVTLEPREHPITPPL